MSRLSSEQFVQAREFIMSTARPLERALFSFEFDTSSPEAVWNELAHFQNPDGGFGRALEPDLRTRQSSVLATVTALKLLRHLATPAENPLLTGALQYLTKTYDPEKHVWRYIPPTAGDAPHAPWWDQEDLAENFGGFRINPRAALAGFLLEHRELLPAEIVQMVYDEVAADLRALHGPQGVNDLECCLILLETPQLPDNDREWMTAKIGTLIGESIERDPDQWGSYTVRPLDVIDTPASPFYPAFRELVDHHLDFILAEQGEDGAWEPNWSWFGSFDDVWPAAKQDWQGVITVKRLCILRAFGRLREK